MKTLRLCALLAGFSSLMVAQPATSGSQLCKISGRPLISSTGTPAIQVTDPQNPGVAQTIQIAADIRCGADGKPAGQITLNGLAMNAAPGYSSMVTTSFPLFGLTGAGTAYFNGACTLNDPAGFSKDCRYWMKLSDAAVSFVIWLPTGEPLAKGAKLINPATGALKVALAPVPAR